MMTSCNRRTQSPSSSRGTGTPLSRLNDTLDSVQHWLGPDLDLLLVVDDSAERPSIRPSPNEPWTHPGQHGAGRVGPEWRSLRRDLPCSAQRAGTQHRPRRAAAGHRRPRSGPGGSHRGKGPFRHPPRRWAPGLLPLDLHWSAARLLPRPLRPLPGPATVERKAAPGTQPCDGPDAAGGPPQRIRGRGAHPGSGVLCLSDVPGIPGPRRLARPHVVAAQQHARRPAAQPCRPRRWVADRRLRP